MTTARGLILAALAASMAVAPAAAMPLPAPMAPLSAQRPSTIDMLRCLAGQGVTLASGHRAGSEPGYPENAIETAAHTLSKAPVLIEVDVRTTRDGVMVLMHDETLERTTTGQGAVGQRTWPELQALFLVDETKTTTPFRIPTLAAMLEAMRGRGVLVIDVKEDASIPFIGRAIAEADAHGYALVNLYRPAQAMSLHAADPRITIMLPVESRDDLEVLRRVGVNLDALAAWGGIEGFDKRDPQLWAELGKAGVPVAFATLFRGDRQIEETGDPKLFADLADQGVDILASDLTMLAYRTLSARRDTPAAITRCGG